MLNDTWKVSFCETIDVFINKLSNVCSCFVLTFLDAEVIESLSLEVPKRFDLDSKTSFYLFVLTSFQQKNVSLGKKKTYFSRISFFGGTVTKDQICSVIICRSECKQCT